MEERHIPVLLKETVDLLDITSGDTVLDCTFGRGGHSAVLLDLVQPNGKLIGIDADQEAAHFAANFTDKSNFVFVQSNFRHLDRVLVSLGIPKVDKILFDLGVSSPQLDDSGRGFSYKYDAQLDMRLNKDQSISAWTIVNNATEEELAKILWTFGEERWAKRIANFIVTSRSAQPIQTTLELVDIIKGAIPKAVREAEDQHPARRTFQAIRIAVNDELGALAQALDKAVAALA
ncbi:MAG: 16S rRNA (cytosine(1402)-N(4))-methyltransferase RsmH, partial [bacterium]|nr:16S rRNA (cytosine(1402)-N(4))-methyltransferase RsmH [bacterium]